MQTERMGRHKMLNHFSSAKSLSVKKPGNSVPIAKNREMTLTSDRTDMTKIAFNGEKKGES